MAMDLQESNLGSGSGTIYFVSIRDLEIGKSIYVYLAQCNNEVKNSDGQVFNMINGLLLDPIKANDFDELLDHAYKCGFVGNVVINNAIQQGKIADTMTIKITKKANKGDVVQQKFGNKKINYYDYDIKVITFNLEEKKRLEQHYNSDASNFIDPSMTETTPF